MIKIINILKGKEPIWLNAIAPKAFQKIPTVKNVILIALRKSIPNVLINKIVISKPVPEDIDPFNIPIKKLKPINTSLEKRLTFLGITSKPKLGLKKEYDPKNIENNPNNIYRKSSDKNSTIEAPRITPGTPNNIN
tara:strand:- start:15 stop:422 length:408 start_codon:yes stop_codon:yes gene_type:complete